ncbi:NACHT domain-containing NTPase [Mesorhizobium japonicum]|nr:NACHT domain-containing NTPase [Mesorhizobium japonicum]
MTRTVRQTNAPYDKPEEARPRLFSDFESAPNIVLLGDPGAGKSYLFREAAHAEGVRSITARAFLVTPPTKLAGKVLFIDGLDERRTGRGDLDTVGQVVEKLFAIGPAKVRISCRAPDWLGDSDLAAFGPYFDQMGTPPVLLLQKLSHDEQRAVLAAQGVEPGDADSFLVEAERRGLSDFLENPQNLIMLSRAVQTGSWPKTRRELFELSTGLMLQEFDKDHARKGVGVFSAAELRDAAGGICAARLIADVEAISLTEQEGTLESPGYRSLTFLDPAKAQAALGRRVFVAGPEAETVDYAHRTTAEYLAAAFLAQKVRDGLPFGRVMALMGVDGHPASELRGLHAWLAIHLPEHADELIETDPYGVLAYGDAASLSPSSCMALLRSLGRLSKSDPWFRSGNWDAPPIGALSRPDMVEEFRAILNDPDAGFGIRSVVIDALRLGTPHAELQRDLVSVISGDAPYSERVHALEALLRLGEEGKSAIVAAFRTRLGKTANDLRLRAEIIEQLYGNPFGHADVVQLVNDTLQGEEDFLATGTLWVLADSIPVADLPSLLDGIATPQQNEYGQHNRRHSEVATLFTRSLVRAWREPGPFDAERALRWLHKRLAFDDDSQVQELRDAIIETPENLEAMASHFFGTLVADSERWQKYSTFQRSTLQALPSGPLLRIVVEQLTAAEDGSARRAFFYELALTLCYRVEQPRAGEMFGALYELAEREPSLKPIRAASVKSDLYDGYFKGRKDRQAENDAARESQRAEFAQKVEAIRSGADLGWLNHLGKIYFGLYNDVDRSLEPRDRVAAWVGENHIDSALAGLRAALSRNDLPTFADVMALAAAHKRRDWWHALVAGLNERWAIGEGFAGLTDDFLKAILVFDLANPGFVNRDETATQLHQPWKDGLVKQHSDLARDAYLALARLRLSAEELGVDGLHELLTAAAFEPYRKDIALELLRDFPNANLFRLGDMLDAITKLPNARAEFLALAANVVLGTAANNEPRYAMWLAAAYLLSPAQFADRVEAFARNHPAIIFQLRDRSGFASGGQATETALSLPQLEFMARLTGTLFPEAPYPSGGWSGDTNAWDAAEYCRKLFDTISAQPTEAATLALERLVANTELASYKPHMLHALANQRKRRRDVEYDRPNWPRTVAALSNGPPATVADLQALVIDQLRDLKKRIERENTDIFKQFWNIDAHAKPVDPRPEEACRDDLLTLMRPPLQALGIISEPEGHMVRDKRADIAVSIAAHKILCELKRDNHPELWTAAIGQLDRFYTPDPGAKGFGIYCVFWFGDKRKGAIPAPPEGLSRPTSADELEQMLKYLLPENSKNRIAIIVIDVSGEV